MDGRYNNLVRLLVGYGCPALVVLLTLTVAYGFNDGEAYGHDNDLCWLQEDTFIWAFAVPAAIAIAFNIFVLARSLRVVFQVQRRRSEDSLVSKSPELFETMIESLPAGIKTFKNLDEPLSSNRRRRPPT